MGEEVRAAGRITGKKSFCRRPHHRQEGFCRTTGKKAFAAPQARRFLQHHRQEGFSAPQARRFLPHLRRDGFVSSQRTNNISLPLQISVFLLLTGNKSKDKTIGKVNETGLVYLETELVLPG